jgi:hypothetical protein
LKKDGSLKTEQMVGLTLARGAAKIQILRGLGRIHAVKREDFNAKAPRRKDAKRIMTCKTDSPNGEYSSASQFRCFPLRLWGFATLR